MLSILRHLRLACTSTGTPLVAWTRSVASGAILRRTLPFRGAADDVTAEWRRRYRARLLEMETRHPCLFDLKMTIRSSKLVQETYRHKLKELIGPLLEESVYATERQNRDLNYEDLLCLIPADAFNDALLHQLETLSNDILVAEAAAQETHEQLSNDRVARQLARDKQAYKLKKRSSRSSYTKTCRDVHKQYDSSW
eukprot:TRINITY_DN36513_c0_g1_i1.p1 TRINITY_DN36513_c0_g1~~TRINITY_DN36513_c0_g1_i1.p1  ORF type:complete len:196 (-),score=19.24 TRINITY_DN36513_c0_g1_i1:55-642(-)